jgi:hypothetical protein
LAKLVFPHHNRFMICAKTAAWLEKEIEIKDEKQFQMLGENIKKNHIYDIVAYPALLYKWATIIFPQAAWNLLWLLHFLIDLMR